MNQIEENLAELNKLQNLQQRSHWMNDLHPLGKLLTCVLYIVFVASFDKYNLQGLILMAIFPVFGFIVGELSFKEAIYRMRLILPLVVFVGLFNPIFDREVLFYIGGSAPGAVEGMSAASGAAEGMSAAGSTGFAVTGGMISMLTLMLKGFYAVLSAYILIATTSIEDICYALRLVHIPKIIVTVILLIYRYFGLMANEADRISTAYKLRAPNQKGIKYTAWGTLVGQWLLRSMDRATAVYESMALRGFDGEFRNGGRVKKANTIDFVYPIAWLIICIAIRVM